MKDARGAVTPREGDAGEYVDDGQTAADLATLVVGSMCHCADPDDCYDHWQFYFDAEMSADGEHVRRGRTLGKRHMDALATLGVAWSKVDAMVRAEHSGTPAEDR